MAQMPALIPKEVEIQRLKKIYIMVIMLGSIAASVEVDNFVDGSLHQTAIRDSAFTPAHWWLYSHFVALPLGWGFVAIYDRRVPILRGPNNSMNTGLKITIIGYLATMFTNGRTKFLLFFIIVHYNVAIIQIIITSYMHLTIHFIGFECHILNNF